jgi:ATP-dependent protease ClpP protease subunit
MQYIAIIGDISHDTLAVFYEQFRAIRGKLTVEICSGGGDMQPAFAIADMIAARGNVTTIASGMVGSAAVPIFTAGHKRLIRPIATVYLHPPRMSLKNATAQQMVAEAFQFDVDCRNYCLLIANNTGLEIEKVLNWIRDDFYMPAEQAVALGFAHSILKREPK